MVREIKEIKTNKYILKHKKCKSN